MKISFCILFACFFLKLYSSDDDVIIRRTDKDTIQRRRPALLFEPKVVVKDGNNDTSVIYNYSSVVNNDQINIQGDEIFLPADALYQSVWNTTRVNYNKENISVPDTFLIDVSQAGQPLRKTIVTSRYGPRWGRVHNGIDLRVSLGDTIYSAFSGLVRLKYYQRYGYGYYLVIRHDNGLETIYAHLDDFLVNLNERVKAGDPIAIGGNSGKSTGAHLHFEIRFVGIPLNPEDIFCFCGKEKIVYDDSFLFVNRRD